LKKQTKTGKNHKIKQKSSFLRFQSNHGRTEGHTSVCCRYSDVVGHYKLHGYIFGHEKYQKLMIFHDFIECFEENIC
jgi:hypothetical protein